MKTNYVLLVLTCLSIALVGTAFILLHEIVMGAIMLFCGTLLSTICILFKDDKRLMSPGIYTNRIWKDDVINILTILILGSIAIYFLLN